MANEFKIKNALLIEGSTNTHRIIAVRNESTDINTDASAILVTGKSIYDYVEPWQVSQDSSIERIDVSINNVIDIFDVIEASLATYVKKAGDTMTGVLVFDNLGFTLDSVTIATIDTSTEGLGQLDTAIATSGVVRSYVNTLTQNLETSVGALDTSIGQLDTQIQTNVTDITNLETSVGALDTLTQNIDTSIGTLDTYVNNLETSVGALDTLTQTHTTSINSALNHTSSNHKHIVFGTGAASSTITDAQIAAIHGVAYNAYEDVLYIIRATSGTGSGSIWYCSADVDDAEVWHYVKLTVAS